MTLFAERMREADENVLKYRVLKKKRHSASVVQCGNCMHFKQESCPYFEHKIMAMRHSACKTFTRNAERTATIEDLDMQIIQMELERSS